MNPITLALLRKMNFPSTERMGQIGREEAALRAARRLGRGGTDEALLALRRERNMIPELQQEILPPEGLDWKAPYGGVEEPRWQPVEMNEHGIIQRTQQEAQTAALVDRGIKPPVAETGPGRSLPLDPDTFTFAPEGGPLDLPYLGYVPKGAEALVKPYREAKAPRKGSPQDMDFQKWEEDQKYLQAIENAKRYQDIPGIAEGDDAGRSALYGFEGMRWEGPREVNQAIRKGRKLGGQERYADNPEDVLADMAYNEVLEAQGTDTPSLQNTAPTTALFEREAPVYQAKKSIDERLKNGEIKALWKPELEPHVKVGSMIPISVGNDALMVRVTNITQMDTSKLPLKERLLAGAKFGLKPEQAFQLDRGKGYLIDFEFPGQGEGPSVRNLEMAAADRKGAKDDSRLVVNLERALKPELSEALRRQRLGWDGAKPVWGTGEPLNQMATGAINIREGQNAWFPAGSVAVPIGEGQFLVTKAFNIAKGKKPRAVADQSSSLSFLRLKPNGWMERWDWEGKAWVKKTAGTNNPDKPYTALFRDRAQADIEELLSPGAAAKLAAGKAQYRGKLAPPPSGKKPTPLPQRTIEAEPILSGEIEGQLGAVREAVGRRLQELIAQEIGTPERRLTGPEHEAIRLERHRLQKALDEMLDGPPSKIPKPLADEAGSDATKYNLARMPQTRPEPYYSGKYGGDGRKAREKVDGPSTVGRNKGGKVIQVKEDLETTTGTWKKGDSRIAGGTWRTEVPGEVEMVKGLPRARGAAKTDTVPAKARALIQRFETGKPPKPGEVLRELLDIVRGSDKPRNTIAVLEAQLADFSAELPDELWKKAMAAAQQKDPGPVPRVAWRKTPGQREKNIQAQKQRFIKTMLQRAKERVTGPQPKREKGLPENFNRLLLDLKGL